MTEPLIPYIEQISNNHLFITFILSMLPITELRGSIPWAYLYTELPLISIFLISVLGNFLITIPITVILNPAILFFSRWKISDIFFTWLLNRTRKRGDMVKRFHFWGLVLFVAVPLPVTGAWTGCIAAYIFGIPKPKGVLAILLGLCLSGSIVSLLLISGSWIIN